MIPVERITEQELERRFNSLPEVLQEALDSVQNFQVVNRICESNLLLDEERKLIVQQIAALVFLGYIHPEKVALELEQELGVNHKVAASIAEALNSRLFSGLKNEIDKIYAPFAPEEKKVEEVKKPFPFKTPAPVGEVPMSPKPVGIAPKPFIDLSSLSKTPAPAPQVKPISVPSLTGLPIQEKLKTYGAPPKPSGEALGGTPPKEDKAGVTPPGKNPPPAPPPTTPPAPAPLLLKRELELEPLKPQTNIRLEPTSQFGAAKGTIPQPPKPARLELGKLTRSETGGPPKPAKTEMTPPRVVNYSQWQTPTTRVQPPTPPAKPAPKPPTPPVPPKPSGEALGDTPPKENKPEVLPTDKPGSETSGGAPRKEDKTEVLLPGKPPAPPAKN